MAVKLRLMRMGKKKQPTYRVVAADARAPRDGRFIELIGRYDPRPDPSVVEIDNDKAVRWLNEGAQPTPQVRKLLEISGAWADFRIGRGDVHVAAATVSESEVPVAPAVRGHQPEIHVVGEDAAPVEAAPEDAEPEPVAAAADEAPEAEES